MAQERHSGSASENDSPPIQADKKYKIVLLGDGMVGKTCLLSRFAEDNYYHQYNQTIRIDFKGPIVHKNGNPIHLKIWDTAGQPAFRPIPISVFKGAHVLIFVFELANKDSFNNLEAWHAEAMLHSSANVIKVLVGTKADLCSKKAPDEAVKQFALRHGMDYFEVSAKNNTGIKEMFEVILNKTFKVFPFEPPEEHNMDVLAALNTQLIILNGKLAVDPSPENQKNLAIQWEELRTEALKHITAYCKVISPEAGIKYIIKAKSDYNSLLVAHRVTVLGGIFNKIRRSKTEQALDDLIADLKGQIRVAEIMSSQQGPG